MNICADGIYSGLRSDDVKLYALVVIGVNEHGQKRILTLEDGVRESARSWRELLLGLNICRAFTPPIRIESTFSMIRHRTTRTKGCLNRNGMQCMKFKLEQSAEKRWRQLRGFRQLGEVIEGAQFKDGIEESMLNNQVGA